MNPRPFPAASLLTLLLIGSAWAYLIGSETPRGGVTGTTVLSDADNKPFARCDVYLTPSTPDESGDALPSEFGARKGRGEARERRHAVTDSTGRFSLKGVPAGTYSLSASSRWHSAKGVQVSVQEGHTAAAMLRLARSEPDLSVGDHQATFATSEAPFLPLRGYTTLPKPSANPTPAVMQVKIWRTRLSEVLKRGDASAALDKLRYSYNGNQDTLDPALLHPVKGEAEPPVPVFSGTMPIKDADREGFFAYHLPLSVAQGKPGLYLARFGYGKFSSCSYVLVTNLALVVKKSPGEVVAYVARLERGTPVVKATVRVLRKGRTLASGQTDADGVTRLALPTALRANPNGDAGDAENDTPTLTMATLGDDEAVVNGGGSGSGDDSRNGYVTHVVTDRTVYRPGDTIQYKGITRARQDGADGSHGYRVPRGVPVSVEVRDATGGLVVREEKVTGGRGTFSGTIGLSPEGATGSYTLVTTIAGKPETTEIAVAAYRKPEFAVTVTPTKARYTRGETVEMALSGTYYFGAPVAGAKVKYSVYRDADWSSEFGNLSEDAGDTNVSDEESGASYHDKAYNAYYGESVGEGEATLDENGKTVVRVRTDIRHPGAKEADKADKKSGASDEAIPQSETYTLSAEVVDESKRSVSGEGAATVAAGDLSVSVAPEGYVATPGEASQIFVTVRDPRKNPVPGTVVTLTTTYDEWNAKKKESTTRPFGGARTATTGPDGRAILSITPPRTGEIRLVAVATDSGGRAIRAEGSLWAAGDKGDDLDTDYGDLSLLTDKRHYAPGDTARVLINASRVGQTALLCVEGDRVYHVISVPLRKHSTVVRVLIEAAWGPNVALVANYVRDKRFATSEAPLRVSVPARQLAVSVRPVGGDHYHPGDRVTYAVTTKEAVTGRPVSSDFALGVVDESIYALREDEPGALRTAFYPRRNNRVSTNFSFSVEYLGDVSKAEPKIKARTKFRDTAFWEPEGQTDSSGSAIITVTLPDNLTTWRATVKAVSDDTAVGYARSKVISSKPFFARLETPRYLVGGDNSRITALVHNETGNAQSVQVRLVAANLRLAAGSPETQSVKVASGGVGTVNWDVTPSANASGDAPLRLTAWTPKEAGRESFTDGVEQTLPIRAYGRIELTTFAGMLEGDTATGTGTTDAQPDTLSVTPDRLTLRIDAAAVPRETRLTLRVLPGVRGALGGGLDYLVGFPYGCTEQTMSRFYPDLLARDFGGVTDPAKTAELPRMVRDGLARLARFQHSETGGWGWWESDKDDPFMTAYVLVGLSNARTQSYPVDNALMERGMKAAAAMAITAPPRARPFLLYALSNAGYDDAKTGLLHAPFRYSAKRTGLIPAKLPTDALAYLSLLGDRLGENYRPFSDELERRAVVEGRLIHWTAFPGKQRYDDCSDRMATALALRVLLAIHSEDDGRIGSTLRYLMQSRTDGYFGDTRDTAWVLVALCDYLKTHPADAAPLSGTLAVTINGVTAHTVDLANDTRGEKEVVITLPTDALRPGANTVRFMRGADAAGGTIFYSGVLRQTVSAPTGSELPPITGRGVTVRRELLRVLPRKVGADAWRLATEPVTDGRFNQGDRLRVRLTITAERDASYVLIEDTFPSGAEVTERGTADEEQTANAGYFWFDHTDVRDDRIAFFARKIPKGKQVIEYNLRAQTPGTCRALPTSVQAMYDAGFHGESGATPLEIRP